MKLRLIRHATLVLEYGGKNILIDPMFAPRGTYPGVAVLGPGRGRRNPLVDLPCAPELLAAPDIVLVTHLHVDHFDKTAAALLPKDVPIVCQSGDDVWLRECGFQRINGLEGVPVTVQGVHFTRTDGRHGRFFTARLTGWVSGFVLRAPDEPTVYIAGDTVWCQAAAQAIEVHRPEVVVVNDGAERLLFGRPITMDARDLFSVLQAAPDARVIAVHMDAFNHCRLTRKALKEKLERAGLNGRTAIPADGETLFFT